MKKNQKNESVLVKAAAMLGNIEGLKAGNRETKSVSSCLKLCTSSQCLKAGYAEVFAAVGVDEPKKLTPKVLFAMVPEQYKRTNKNGVTDIFVWALKKDKEESEKAGIPVKIEYLKRVVSWTPKVLFTLLAQIVCSDK